MEHFHARNIVDGKPTLEYARQMTTSYGAMSNTGIIYLCKEGDRRASMEAVVRNIMVVDSVEYDEASKVLDEMLRFNKNQMHAHIVPYVTGLTAAMTGFVVSWPLVFGKETARWFNDEFVTMDLPAPGEVETVLEVGSWTWSWMEPIMGQISFALLTLQFARNQLINIGIKPYQSAMRQYRARQLVKKYPRYDVKLLTDMTHSVNYTDDIRIK